MSTSRGACSATITDSPFSPIRSTAIARTTLQNAQPISFPSSYAAFSACASGSFPGVICGVYSSPGSNQNAMNRVNSPASLFHLQKQIMAKPVFKFDNTLQHPCKRKHVFQLVCQNLRYVAVAHPALKREHPRDMRTHRFRQRVLFSRIASMVSRSGKRIIALIRTAIPSLPKTDDRIRTTG